MRLPGVRKPRRRGAARLRAGQDGLSLMPWSAPFDEPIELRKGRKLVTLKDTAAYIIKLPKVGHTTPEWQAAMEALIPVADLGGSTIFARIGIMKALNQNRERVFNPDRKDHHWGKRKLARDR